MMTGIANLVIWPSLFEKQRRIILSAGMFAVHGRIQREGGSGASRGPTSHRPIVRTRERRRTKRGVSVAAWTWRRIPPWQSGARSAESAQRPEAKNIYDPYGHINQIKVKPRDFK
jgi:error-prone DNA polymerase